MHALGCGGEVVDAGGVGGGDGVRDVVLWGTGGGLRDVDAVVCLDAVGFGGDGAAGVVIGLGAFEAVDWD